ncbi:hypothetical protein D3C86_1317750 [compost metagenome]
MTPASPSPEVAITKLNQELALMAEKYNATLQAYTNALKSQRNELISHLAANSAYVTLFEAVREIGIDLANDIQQARTSQDPGAAAVAAKMEPYANALANALQASVNARRKVIDDRRASYGLGDEDLTP